MTGPSESMTDCPTEETLAAFVDGMLDENARAGVIAHLANCSECRDVVLTAADFRAETAEASTGSAGEGQAPIPFVRERRSRVIPAMLAAAAMIAAILFGVPQFRERLLPGSDVDRVARATAALRYRPTEARLSGEYPYRAVRPLFRGRVEEPEAETSTAFLAAASRVNRPYHESSLHDASLDHLQATAAIRFYRGRTDDAVSLLETAVRRCPCPARTR